MRSIRKGFLTYVARAGFPARRAGAVAIHMVTHVAGVTVTAAC